MFVRYLIGKQREISQDLYSIKVLISSYRAGLESLYQTELFYGEPTIEKLLENTKDLDRELLYILELYGFEDFESNQNQEQQEEVSQ